MSPSVFLQIETGVTLVASAALLAVDVWALVCALRFRPDAYTAADKRTKGFWCLLTAGAVLLGALALTGKLSLMFALIGIVMAGVFLADVLPALRTVMGNAQGRYRFR